MTIALRWFLQYEIAASDRSLYDAYGLTIHHRELRRIVQQGYANAILHALKDGHIEEIRQKAVARQSLTTSPRNVLQLP